jgi:hypothetical protein
MALYLYDAVSMYMSVVDGVVRTGRDYRNGTLVYGYAKNQVFKG